MNYPTPYGNSDDLALENARLKALVKELKSRPDPWTQVFECKEIHEDPYDFDYCEVHDRTFERGGYCDHKDLSEIDYIDKRETEQRARAVKAEMKLDEIRWWAEETPTLVDADSILSILNGDV